MNRQGAFHLVCGIISQRPSHSHRCGTALLGLGVFSWSSRRLLLCHIDFHPSRSQPGSEPMYAVTDSNQFGGFEQIDAVARQNSSGSVQLVARDASGGEQLYGDGPSDVITV